MKKIFAYMTTAVIALTLRAAAQPVDTSVIPSQTLSATTTSSPTTTTSSSQTTTSSSTMTTSSSQTITSSPTMTTSSPMTTITMPDPASGITSTSAIIFPTSSRQNQDHHQDQNQIQNNAVAFTQILRRRVAEDARIISPPIHSVLRGPTTYEIAPLIHVDSVLLFVRHSHTLVDTLGMFASPPYRATWNPANVPDQDQMHLQFGYTLFSGDTLISTSPPQPHKWMLDRRENRDLRPRENRGGERPYRARQLAFTAFEVNGDWSKWSEIPFARVGGVAEFKLLWTSARLHFIIGVRDSSVTPGDFVELHIDMHRDRASFSDVNHRSLRYSPLSGSRSFVVELTEDGFVRADSVNALINDETEWKVVLGENGYTIEAAIPFAALSDEMKPQPVIGLDVTVMNVDHIALGVNVVSHYSWSGASSQYFRYSPSAWGDVRMGRATFALQIIFVAVIFLTCAAFVFFIAHTYFTEHRASKHDPIDDDDYSPVTENLLDIIDEKLCDVNFAIDDAARATNISADEINAALEKDMGVNFAQLLTFKRVKRSQKLMRDSELSVTQIAALCGFASEELYREAFKSQMRLDPDVSRQALLDSIQEDEQARLDDEDDDDDL